MNNSLCPPAQLWIGTPNITAPHTVQFLQKNLCSAYDSCNASCTSCIHVTEKQHARILWISPEKQYTLDDLAPLFKKIQFTLDSQEQFFFILESADFLSAVCANALLKSLEEPPQGYHFILLATRQHAILPTIQSRCLIQVIGSSYTQEDNQLLAHFKTTGATNPAQFLKIVDSTKPNERKATEMIDYLFTFWLEQYKRAQKDNNHIAVIEAHNVVTLLQEAYKRPIMPGSAKLFLKNLFLKIKQK